MQDLLELRRQGLCLLLLKLLVAGLQFVRLGRQGWLFHCWREERLGRQGLGPRCGLRKLQHWLREVDFETGLGRNLQAWTAAVVCFFRPWRPGPAGPRQSPRARLRPRRPPGRQACPPSRPLLQLGTVWCRGRGRRAGPAVESTGCTTRLGLRGSPESTPADACCPPPCPFQRLGRCPSLCLCLCPFGAGAARRPRLATRTLCCGLEGGWQSPREPANECRSPE